MIERQAIFIRGIVQGVGFRPFVYRLARELNLKGWVANNFEGVQIEVEGEGAIIQEFSLKLKAKKPLHSEIYEQYSRPLPLQGDREFIVKKSEDGGTIPTAILPDLATCQECLSEILNPSDRRYLYPFTNCTLCGPRFSIIEALPYDRKNTTLRIFPMCSKCEREYEDPSNRRFHAQPNACPDCGPHLELFNTNRELLSSHNAALKGAAQAVLEGKILALKGIGGFQLIVDATQVSAVQLLRQRKHRPAKPLAVMYPDLQSIHQACHVSEMEEALLLSGECPIVILEKRMHRLPGVAPDNPNLGVMLPYSPLHHLLLGLIKRPIVATSGNLSEEPICIENDDAFSRLGRIANFFLVHNRSIVRPIDDSVVRVMDNKAVIFRRARGYAPAPIRLKNRVPSTLAVGGHLKNTVSIAHGNNVIMSQHIGDLENRPSFRSFERAIDDLSKFYQIVPFVIAHDLHPHYKSTQWAEARTGSKIPVQHHLAHFFSCMAEYQNDKPALGVTWDGSGYGFDGKIWGGEFFHWNGRETPKHFATFRSFPLPGGTLAIKEPRRAAIGLLYELMGPSIFDQNNSLWKDFTAEEKRNFAICLEKKINAPQCTSVGRLFDVVAGLLGICPISEFEGQAAQSLEFLAIGSSQQSSYSYCINQKEEMHIIDWSEMIHSLLNDQTQGVSPTEIAGRFHNTLALIIVSIAKIVNEKRVFLSGGVFQNKLLLEKSTSLLRNSGFEVFTHEKIPPNDGGISLGQVYYNVCCMQPNQGPNQEV